MRSVGYGNRMTRLVTGIDRLLLLRCYDRVHFGPLSLADLTDFLRPLLWRQGRICAYRFYLGIGAAHHVLSFLQRRLGDAGHLVARRLLRLGGGMVYGNTRDWHVWHRGIVLGTDSYGSAQDEEDARHCTARQHCREPPPCYNP